MTPILPRIPAYPLWMVWLATAAALLIAKPWGGVGWDEWLVVVFPLLLIHPSVRFVDVLIGGLAASGLAWSFLGDPSGGWLELACLWSVLVAGTVVGFVTTRAGLDRPSEFGVVDSMSNESLFMGALNRELCRARRDEGSFALLSLDREEYSDTSLRSVCELLDTELRSYADIAQVGERVLALVPNVRDSQYAPLLKRLTERSKATDCGELRIGLARFPQDAACAEDLIDLADRKRIVREAFTASCSSDVHDRDQGQMAS